MKISQLPQEVKEKALEYQKNADKHWDKKTDNLRDAFDLEDSKEKHNYWYKWQAKKFKETVK
jgi:hypothetical protein